MKKNAKQPRLRLESPLGVYEEQRKRPCSFDEKFVAGTVGSALQTLVVLVRQMFCFFLISTTSSSLQVSFTPSSGIGLILTDLLACRTLCPELKKASAEAAVINHYSLFNSTGPG